MLAAASVKEDSGNIQEIFTKRSGNIHGLFGEYLRNIQEAFSERRAQPHPLGGVPVWGTFSSCKFREHSENIQGRSREHSGNILVQVWGTFSSCKFGEYSGRVERTPVSLHPNCKKHLKKIPR
jgi:hypothetical protein